MLGAATSDFPKEGNSLKSTVQKGIHDIFFRAHTINQTKLPSTDKGKEKNIAFLSNDSAATATAPDPKKQVVPCSLLGFDIQKVVASAEKAQPKQKGEKIEGEHVEGELSKSVVLTQSSFSIFIDDDVLFAAQKIKELIEQQNEFLNKGNDAGKVMEELIATVKNWLADGFHPDFVKYVFTTFMNHSHKDIKEKYKKDLPFVHQFTPRHFFNLIEDKHTSEVNTDPVDHYYYKNPEMQLAYWREDMNLNSHHWNWHTVYPGGGVWNDTEKKMKRKDRQGELFIYMHSQLIARYDAERIAFGLPPVRPLLGTSFHGLISQGHDSHLAVFAPRPPNLPFADLNTTTAPTTRADMEKWRDRLLTAVETGEFRVPKKASECDIADFSTANLGTKKEKSSMDLLGDILEADPNSEYRKYYGNLHNMGHNMLSLIHDPDGEQQSIIGVMGDVISAVRDPVFFEWHKHMDSIAMRLQDFLGPNKPEDIKKNAGENIVVEDITLHNLGSVKETDEGWKIHPVWDQKKTDILYTYLEKKKVFLLADGSLVGWQVLDPTTGRGMITSKRTFFSLNNVPFQYRISVANTGKEKVTAWVRIFIAPVENNFIDDYKKWIEMDKFQINLKIGTTVIHRNSFDSSIVQLLGNDPWKYQGEDEAYVNDRETYCRCGLPGNLLLPHGRQGKGQEFMLSVIVTEESNDPKNTTLKSCCARASSYCGSSDPNGEYPDKLPLGYPIDRPFPKNTTPAGTKITRPWTGLSSTKEIRINIIHQGLNPSHAIVEARKKLDKKILYRNLEELLKTKHRTAQDPKANF